MRIFSDLPNTYGELQKPPKRTASPQENSANPIDGEIRELVSLSAPAAVIGAVAAKAVVGAGIFAATSVALLAGFLAGLLAAKSALFFTKAR